VLKLYDLTPTNHPVNFSETGYKWNGLGKSLLKEFTITTSNILVLINSLDNKMLYDENWFEEYTLGKIIQFNTSSPMANMRGKVRKLKKINSIKY
jgi:hypothetical protein